MYNELYHHGVKGMKWGVRRNPQQLGHDPSGGNPKKPTTTTSDLKRAKKSIKNAEGMVTNAKQKREDAIKKQARDKAKNDLTKMSDQELRNIVNRLNMEERYTQVMESRYRETGKSRVDTMLDYAGKALTIGGSALSIAVAIKELQK